MMKKVFFLIGTLSSGGAERVVSNLSLHLNSNFKKHIVLFGNTSKIDYPFNGEILYLDKLNQKNILNKIIAFIIRIYKLKKLKKENKESTFISFLEYPNLLNLMTISGEKRIISVRNHMSTKHKNGIKSCFWKMTIKLMYKRADMIIAVSKEIKKDLIKNFNIDEEKIIVIYNSYSINDIQRLCKEKIDEEYKDIFEKPVIITAGRLSQQKGQWHLIRTFKNVKEKIPNAKLVILGHGELREELMVLSNNLGISKDVHFLGFCENPFKFIAKSKVFVLTSYFEGFPNALAEAMACKIPVISTDCASGPRELLIRDYDLNEKMGSCNRGEYGFLVPSFNKDNENIIENKITNIIIELFKNDEMYKIYSEKSFERIQNFDINTIIRKWEEVI